MDEFASEPLWFLVRLGPAAEQHLSAMFDEERGASGRPSFSDLKKFWWPEIEVAVNYGWRAGAPIPEYRHLPTDVRELAIKPVLSFPPSRVVVARGDDDWPQGELVVIGVTFDWAAWQIWSDQDEA